MTVDGPAAARSLSEVAAAALPTRDRYVDLLRAVAILLVVLGHWLVTALEVQAGTLGGRSVLEILPWTHALTWVFQVMPLFFLVGGYATAASWSSARLRGTGPVAWLQARARRLLRPTTVFVAAVVVAVAGLRAAGVDPQLLTTGAWLVGIGLWFLAVYLAVVALTPLLVRGSARWGLLLPAGLAALTALADVLRIAAGVPYVGDATYGLVWLAFTALGVAWRDGSLLRWRGTPLALALGGGGAFLALVALGPYPISLVGVAGAPMSNTAPPSLALLAAGVAQTGVALLLRGPGRRLVQRPGPWTATVAVNGSIMSIYLWHYVPVALAGPALYLTGIAPQAPVASAAWWALRPVWVVVLAVLLVLLVRVVLPAERWPVPAPRPRGELTPARERTAVGLAALAVGALCLALAQLTIGGLGRGPGGVPVGPLITYAAGLALLGTAARVETARPAD